MQVRPWVTTASTFLGVGVQILFKVQVLSWSKLRHIFSKCKRNLNANSLAKGAISELLLVLIEAKCTAIYCALFKNIFYQSGTGIRSKTDFGLAPGMILVLYQTPYLPHRYWYMPALASDHTSSIPVLIPILYSSNFFFCEILPKVERVIWKQNIFCKFPFKKRMTSKQQKSVFLRRILPYLSILANFFGWAKFDLKNMILTYTKDFPN